MNTDNEQEEQGPGPWPEDALLKVSSRAGLIATVGFSIGAFVVMGMLLNGATILQELAAELPVKTEGVYFILVAGFFVLFLIAALVLYFLYHTSRCFKRGVLEKDASLIETGFAQLKYFFVVMLIVGLLQFIINIMNLFG